MFILAGVRGRHAPYLGIWYQPSICRGNARTAEILERVGRPQDLPDACRLPAGSPVFRYGNPNCRLCLCSCFIVELFTDLIYGGLLLMSSERLQVALLRIHFTDCLIYRVSVLPLWSSPFLQVHSLVHCRGLTWPPDAGTSGVQWRDLHWMYSSCVCVGECKLCVSRIIFANKTTSKQALLWPFSEVVLAYVFFTIFISVGCLESRNPNVL
jgi:hypothetical protein